MSGNGILTLKCHALASNCFKGMRRPLPAPNKVTDPRIILFSITYELCDTLRLDMGKIVSTYARPDLRPRRSCQVIKGTIVKTCVALIVTVVLSDASCFASTQAQTQHGPSATYIKVAGKHTVHLDIHPNASSFHLVSVIHNTTPKKKAYPALTPSFTTLTFPFNTILTPPSESTFRRSGRPTKS